MVAAQECAELTAAIAERHDRDAFTRLFDHFAPRVKSFLMRMGTEEEAAEEITQEVMLTLWRKAALFDPEKSSLSTWLFRIARNRRIDQIRRARSDGIDADDPTLMPEPEPPADAIFSARAREERVRDALTTLPEEQLVLIESAFFRGLSHSQIAEQTGLPLGTVKSRIRLAFERLRRSFEGDERVDTDFSE